MLDQPNMGHNEAPDIEFDELQTILDDLAGKARSVSEANGELRAAIKRVIDDKGFHAKALADIRTIDAMSETRRADYLRTYVPLFMAIYKAKWEPEANDLLSEQETE